LLWDAIHAEGISLPFPQREVRILPDRATAQAATAPRLPASLAIDPALRPPFATGLALALGNFALYAPGLALPAVEIAVLR
jgi:hypothetical protein